VKTIPPHLALVAQGIERPPPKRKVTGSIPVQGTIKMNYPAASGGEYNQEITDDQA
jgi:hypothetical protein